VSDETTMLSDAAAEMRPLLERHALENESNQRITQEVIDALDEAGILRFWVPSELGGFELPPVEALKMLSNLSYADPGVGWVVMATGMITGTTAAYIGESAAQTIFSGDDLALIAGQGTRTGSATAVDGGFLLSGDWQFASGIKHARYIHTSAVITETGEPRIFTLPVEQATLTDNWDVIGLRATGSIDYSIREVFVGEEWTYPLSIRQARRGGGLFRLGTMNFTCICHSGWTLGVARRLLDEVAELAREGRSRAGQLSGDPGFHADYADVEGRFRAAKALLLQTWSDIEATLARDEPLSTRQETLTRLSLHHLTWTGIDVANFALKATATHAIRDTLVARYIRDMMTGCTHVTSSQFVARAIGRELLDVNPDHRWVFADHVAVED
jgi:alkylation response protein AidB-like acyl-CoA dehydrogenase